MLMAILYCDDDRIAAAAPACDQMPFGETYWHEMFAGEIKQGAVFETAYMTVSKSELQNRLLRLGFDAAIDGRKLARELELTATPDYLPRAA